MARTLPPPSKRAGNAVIEVALMAPWILLLFVGIFDFGFYAYAAISTQNAARVGAMHGSGGITSCEPVSVCAYVLGEMNSLPNVRGLTTCDALPLIATVQQTVDPAGGPKCVVSVRYQTVPLFPIPGLTGRLDLRRVAETRVRTEE